ncbi:MAG: tRNA dihydrouridine(16) synthase DusC [Deltaproteobacteria bacterium]|nr:tRNA dihydrouridine(16) synthase DusC [Deltaproteobacteria bacterium]
MHIHLAPMEGVVDSIMRRLLTDIGGFDACVTEFLRVTNTLLPAKLFYKHCPELHTKCHTHAGTPVLYQLLGGIPEHLAENALRAVELGAVGIDLNFGCPAKKVNSHDGGAVLLREPQRLYDIIQCVRAHIPEDIPVSAKIRLGYEDKSLALDIARATDEAGSSHLTVHARTKVEGYKPPAHWEWIARIREVVSLPVIANGDIWCLEDYIRCREITGCEDVMLGRGALARPDLALQIKHHINNTPYTPASWAQTISWVDHMFRIYRNIDDRFAVRRVKQWLRMLGKGHHKAVEFFATAKRLTDADAMQQAILSEQGLPHSLHTEITSDELEHFKATLQP